MEQIPPLKKFFSDLVSLLNESDVKSKFGVVAAKHPWSMDAKQIVNEMNAELNKQPLNHILIQKNKAILNASAFTVEIAPVT